MSYYVHSQVHSRHADSMSGMYSDGRYMHPSMAAAGVGKAPAGMLQKLMTRYGSSVPVTAGQQPQRGIHMMGSKPSVFRAHASAMPQGLTSYPTSLIYQVHFKLFHVYCVAPNHQTYALNDFVMVEADRGEALGIVVACIPPEQYPTLHAMWGIKELKFIKRLATAEERLCLPMKAEDERKAVMVRSFPADSALLCDVVSCAQLCYEKAALVYKLPIVVLDAEFQFDRQKLTIVFKASGYVSSPTSDLLTMGVFGRRIDFRELVRDLYSVYETRIWMSQIETLPIYNRSAKKAIMSGFAPTFNMCNDWTTTADNESTGLKMGGARSAYF